MPTEVLCQWIQIASINLPYLEKQLQELYFAFEISRERKERERIVRITKLQMQLWKK